MLYFAGLDGLPMNGLGRAFSYFALFTEIGLVFLVTTLAGALAGHWLDERLGTNPVFALVGLLGGFAIGAIGVSRLITRFLARFED
ncbi:MAG TPA: AtpZ/AtpI family protein [Candidatus Limnocylindrales bacterium]|jgi:F0F1-type ATP synthase assembly protein I